MEKIKSFRQGRVWLNVFVDENGELILSISKSYPAGDGKWKKTPFLKPRFNDLENLVKLVSDFKVFHKDLIKTMREAQ